MDNIQDDFELKYYQSVCDIQDKCIKGEISKEECKQKLEIERLKYIEYLQMKNIHLVRAMESEVKMRKVIEQFKELKSELYDSDTSD